MTDLMPWAYGLTAAFTDPLVAIVGAPGPDVLRGDGLAPGCRAPLDDRGALTMGASAERSLTVGASKMKWVTRNRPKIDRIACPWLVARFIDKEPEFLYVPTDRVLTVAAETGAIPYDIPNVELSHDGELCSFDTFLKHYKLSDPALQRIAMIVRGADTARFDLAPQAAGLFAISLGLSAIFIDDHEMLRHGMVVYDALYAWCQPLQSQTHN